MTPTSSLSVTGSKRYAATSPSRRHEVVVVVALEALYRRHAEWLRQARSEGLVLPLLEAYLLEFSLVDVASRMDLKAAWNRAHTDPADPGRWTPTTEAFVQALFTEIDRIWQEPVYRTSQRVVYSAQRRGYHGPDLLVEIAYRDASPHEP